MDCDHPYGFDIQQKCRFGCGYVLTQGELDAWDREEQRQMELMAQVPEMNIQCEPMPITDDAGNIVGSMIACSPRTGA